jgi:hypothetical protein
MYYFAASPFEQLKRGRTGTSSLIPFPRVGRSVDRALELEADDNDVVLPEVRAAANRLLYGQKRTGKSSLIPFPRVGRRSDPLWQHKFARGTFRSTPYYVSAGHSLDVIVPQTKR